MTALIIILFVAGVIALLERSHRRAHALDHAPGRPGDADHDRLLIDLPSAARRVAAPEAARPGTRPAAAPQVRADRVRVVS